MLKIAVDAMGGDNAPAEIVKGVVEAMKKDGQFNVLFTGDKQAIEAELAKYKYDPARVEIVHCTEVITNDDMPTKAIRQKTDSSLAVAYDKLKRDGEIGALITAGSTGATLAGGIFNIGRIKGISRPALCPALPNVRGTQTLLCDCGANVDCKPINFVHFAVMASAYAKTAFGIENPKVGLLNNGTEAKKGDELHQQAYELLSKTDCINFGGNVEGRDIMYSDYDVVVSDGFSGNIALKSIEGCGKTVGTVLKKAIFKNVFTLIGALFSWGTISRLQKAMDYHKYGGAVLLGLKKVVVKAHGSAKAKAICPAVLKAADACRNKLTEDIEERLASLNPNVLAGTES
jgi:glycerol-3-phosphate acyltransferase PlsX